jgi:hypothetical protein
MENKFRKRINLIMSDDFEDALAIEMRGLLSFPDDGRFNLYVKFMHNCIKNNTNELLNLFKEEISQLFNETCE